MLYINPLRRGTDMEFEWNPEVVTAVEESEDHRTFTAHLDPAARWQDGEPWTAHDIAFSFELIADDDVPALFYKRSASRLESVRALDDHTVQYVHREVLATRLRDMSFPVVARHVFDNPEERRKDPTLRGSTFWAHLAHDRVVGSGPYRFVEWKTDDQLVVERWEDYPFTKPRFARLVMKILPDPNVALLVFKKGQLHEMQLSAQQFATQTNDEEFRRVGVGLPSRSALRPLPRGGEHAALTAAHPALEREQRLFEREPAAEAGEAAVRADHAVARKDDRQRVGAIGGAHGAHRAGPADALRHLAVRRGRAVGDGGQRVPDIELERRAHRRQRQRELPQLTREVRAQLPHRGPQRAIVAPPRRVRRAAVLAVEEADHAEPLLVAGHRELHHRVVDLGVDHHGASILSVVVVDPRCPSTTTRRRGLAFAAACCAAAP
jgi:hypothetical protein